MYQSYASSPHYSTYEYRSTTPASPHGYFSPRYTQHTATPASRPSPSKHSHQRRATQDYTYASPRTTSYQYAEYASPGYASHPRKPEYVSEPKRTRSKSRRFEAPADAYGGGRTRSKSGTHHTSKTYFVYPDAQQHGFESSEEYLPRYEERYPRTTPPPPYTREQQRHRDAEADYRYHDQVPSYPRADEYTTQPSSRPRRASYATKPQPQPAQHHKPRPTTPKSPKKATDDDARRAGIPAGYSFKNWDPTEEPILLLGSVFDANSLGKWIYDWTVAWHGPATPISEIAGDLWLLLIQLAGKIKRAEEGLPRVRKEENKEMIEDFLESGERLWQRFNKLLKVCESYMMKAAQKDPRTGKPSQMGKKSGCEFVDSIFGRDRQLEGTEKLMTGIRLWSMRFDANCEDILRRS